MKVSVNTESPRNPEKRAKLCDSTDVYDNSDRDPVKRSCLVDITKILNTNGTANFTNCKFQFFIEIVIKE